MIIVIGHLVEAPKRCAVSADPVAPARVNISDRWTDRASLERFRGDEWIGSPTGTELQLRMDASCPPA